MFGRRSRPRPEPQPEPDLTPFDGGLAVLRRDGVVLGHIACEVSGFVTPFAPRTRKPWVWFAIVWESGEKDSKIEDYPPWTYVTEMLDGYIDYAGGGPFTRSKDREGRYDVEWVAPERAELERDRLGFEPGDF